MHAALANNRGEINTRKHIGVKDTHAISSNSSPGRDGEENWRGGGRRGGEGRTMHDLKLQRRPPVVSRRVCTWSYAAKNGLSSPSSSLSPPPPPPFIHPSHPSHPSIHPIHPSILSIHPSIHLFPSSGGEVYNHPRDASMGLGVQREPSPPQPSWHGPGRPNERGREPFLPAPRAPTPPALPRQPWLGVGLRLLRGSIHGNPPPPSLLASPPQSSFSPRCHHTTTATRDG